MKTRKLGGTGIEVGRVGLGAMPLSIDGRPGAAAGRRVIHAALDAGMTLIDTADVYCIDDDDLGHNERLIAAALAERPAADRERVIVATKGGLRRPRGAWVTDGRPAQLRAACERSLAALDSERIDLYQLHAPDPQVPFAESVGALAELQQAGKIRWLGLSNVSAQQIAEAQAIAPIVSVQNRCNLFEREAFDQGVVARCEQQGIAFLPYSTVGGHFGHQRLAAASALRRVAEAHGLSAYELAIAWLLARSPAMIPIPGASREPSVRSSAAVADVELDAQVLAEVEQAVVARA